MIEWTIEKYVDGKLPLPGPMLQAALNLVVEAFYRIAPVYKELPPEWDGSGSPMFVQSEDLMHLHYDKPRALFENFLGKTMKYSMGLWVTGAANLDESQEAMMADACRKAGVVDGDTILDVPSGFGCLADHIMRGYPRSKVVSVTLSDVQYRYIVEKQNQPGHPLHTDRFRMIKEDFAQFEIGQKFDKVISLGIFEHVANMGLALEKIAGMLKPDGACFLHYIAHNRMIRRFAEPDPDGFFHRYIFPGGRIWPFQEIFRHQQRLKIETSWFLNGSNYRRTLEAWLSNFRANLERIRRIEGMDERWLRIWEFYLRYCIAMFGGMNGTNVGNGQFLLRHAKVPA